jgi:hypothetical protein
MGVFWMLEICDGDGFMNARLLLRLQEVNTLFGC